MKLTITTISVAVAIVAVLALGAVIAWVSTPTQSLAGMQIPSIGLATTSKAQAVTTSAIVISTSTNPTDATKNFVRTAFSICNPSSTVVYLLANNGNGVNIPGGSGATMAIAAAAGYDACWTETAETFPYNGTITASSTNQTSATLQVIEYVHQ